MALDDFFRRQREEQEQKREAERALYEKQQKEREAKEEFEKKLPPFFTEAVDPAIQSVVGRFRKENLDGIYAYMGRKFRVARPAAQLRLMSRDFHVDFHRNIVQFYIFGRMDNFRIVVEVSTDPKLPELKSVDASTDYAMEEFGEEVLLRIVGTALEKMETLMNGDSGVIRL